MKLVNAKYSLEIDFVENICDMLVVENRNAMSDIIRNLYNQYFGLDGDFILSEKKEIRIDKTIEMIFNPYAIDINNKKINTALYKKMTEYAQELIMEKNRINSEINMLIDRIIIMGNYNGLEHEYDFAWADLFKLYGVHYDDNFVCITERIIEYIKVMSSICDFKIFTFVNLRTMLNDEDIIYLIECANYNKVNLLFIEGQEYDIISNERVHIIDKDLCLIQK